MCTHTQTHARQTHTQTQTQVCFFISYLINAEAIKVNAINIIQNKIYKIFFLSFFISF